MKIINLHTKTEYALSPGDRISCAIGNFDGVHLGHRALISLAARKQKNITHSAVWTFSEPSSRKLGGVCLLTSPSERYEIFRSLGIDLLFLTDFDEVRSLSPEDFVKEILFEKCKVRLAVCGFNFRYGKMAAGNALTLKNDMEALGAATCVVEPFCLDGAIVSSSAIREALCAGEPERAAKMLSRPYSIITPVIHGKKLGRTLGFPTANQHFPVGRVIPRFGVYAVRLHTDEGSFEGVANVGLRPTVEYTPTANCESFIFDFNGDLYGKTVKTEFCAFLRPEQRFSDIDSLSQAIRNDICNARDYFRSEKERML